MLRGSAPSAGSGAPYRTGSEIRPTIWPPPAHQNELIGRNYGIYSLFPGPNDNAKTLYTPTAKAAHSGSAFQNFLASPKVSDSFFSAKFPSFGPNGTSPFSTSEAGIIDRGISRVDLLSKTSNCDSAKSFSPSHARGEPKDECAIRGENLIKPKRLSDEIVIIKNEVDEVAKNQREKDGEQGNGDVGDDDGDDGKVIRRKELDRENKGGVITPSISYDNDSTNIPVEGGLSNEPDSTECKHTDENKGSEVCSSETERLEKNCTVSGNEIEEIITPQKGEKISGSECDKIVNKEKCNNISMIDLSVNDVGRSNNRVKPEKCLVKVESINDICSRLTEKKYVRSKTPDSSCKSLTVNCKHTNNEPSKPSPNRALSLSANKGGCSRTTPVTFKHLTQQELYSKSQNLNVEVPSVVIKKEPVDFQKYPNGASPSYLNLTPLDNLFNPNNLRVLHGPLLSPIPYRDSYESSTRLQDSFLSPGGMPSNFLSPSSSFLSSRPVSESPFLSPKLDLNDFGAYKSYRNLPGANQNYLLNGDVPKIAEGLFAGSQNCLGSEDRRGGAQENNGFVNSTTCDNEIKNVSPGGSGNASSSGSNSVNVTPCQVAEVTSASSLLSPKIPLVNPLMIKQEATSSTSSGSASSSTSQKNEVIYMPSGQSTAISSTVGGALTRHRCQQRPSEIKMSSSVLPPPPGVHRTIQSPVAFNLSSTMGTAVYSGGLSCEERSTAVWPTQAHNPTIWQYSAAPIDYPPFPPVGFQLVRDPITGHFLLIPSSNIEALQRAVLWPSYQPTPHQMIIPPITVQPNPPSLLLDTNVSPVDFLAPEAMNRTTPQHRILITADNTSKRKIPPPAIIKLESSDCSSAIVVTSYENNNFNTKSQSTSASQGENNVRFSQRSSEITETFKSQVTSPAPHLSPVFENSPGPSSSSNALHVLGQSKDQTITVTLQDACNQTDLLPFAANEESHHSSSISRDRFEPYIKITEQNNSLPKMQDMGTDMTFPKESTDEEEAVKRETRKKIDKSLNIQISDVPGINIKKEIVSPTQVDLSGLELLSNSIEQLMHEKKEVGSAEKCIESSVVEGDKKDLSNDACEGAVLLQNLKNGFREVENINSFQGETSKNFDGLGILCALVEQRFQEEIGEEIDEDTDKPKLDEDVRKKEKENNVCDNEITQSCHNEIKDCDLNSNYQADALHLNKIKIENTIDEDVKMEEIVEPLKIYKITLPEEQQHVKESENIQTSHQPQIGTVKRGPGRPKKKVTGKNSEIKSTTPPLLPSKENEKSKEMSPPVLEKETDYLYKNEKNEDSMGSLESNCQADILNPPKLTPSAILDPVSKPKTENDQFTSYKAKTETVKLGQNCEATKKSNCDLDEGNLRKRKSLDDDGVQHSSSKKRKVGRPKKSLSSQTPLTETIVAKIPKTKTNYLFQGDSICEKSKKLNGKIFENGCKRKNSFVKLTTDLIPLTDGGTLESDLKKNNKIRPKLKAEPKVKEWTSQVDDEQTDWKKNVQAKEETCKQKLKIQKKLCSNKNGASNGSLYVNKAKEVKLPSCVLTSEHLKSDKFPIRTLTVMGGLFYAGQLSAIRAPDVYGITIDGERGNRPHIYSREEILRDSILEMKLEKTVHLTPGTRCCAYWSEQYRCLYPGTVSQPASPNPDLDEKFVNVEFDDGDSGRINIDDIRLLPEDYPVVQYDPNPLQSLTKRRRRISGASVESHSKERKPIDSLSNVGKMENEIEKTSEISDSIAEETEPKKLIHICESSTFLSLESERKHLKKKRREKLKRLQSLSIDGKKKHKKHRCSDEHRHHRHHKKHRKHKHKHGKRHSGEMNGDIKTQDEAKTTVTLNKDSSEKGLRNKAKNKCKSVENSCKMSDNSKIIKPKKCKKRTESVESRSKMAAFLPARQLWGWSGKGYKRPGAKGRARKEFYKTIQRGKERITVGDCAVFLSTGRPDRPYIGRIESMWESWGTNMIVKVKWFYHPEETVGCPSTLEYPGALFESPHVDENDVQTISHKCEVLPLKDYTAKIGNSPHRYETIYDNNDIYYLAGYYDPTNTTLRMEPGVK